MNDDKDDKLNKAEEFLYKLSLRADFQRDLQVTRLAIDLPQEGFSKESERQRWLSENKGFDGMGALFAMQHLQQKYKIPFAYLLGLDSYLFFGDGRNMTWQDKWGIAQIIAPKHTLKPDEVDIEELYIDSKEPYAKILIFGNSQKSDVLEYINKNWRKVEETLIRQGGSPIKRVGKTMYKERNSLIKKLWATPTKDLQKEAESESTFKELLIQHVLRKRGFGKVNEGYIRKLCTNK